MNITAHIAWSKARWTCLLMAVAALGTSCKQETKQEAEVSSQEPTPYEAALRAVDIPVLPVKEGDFWQYDLHIYIPPGVTSQSAAEVDLKQQRRRVYVGKIKPNESLPEVDTFEIFQDGIAPERELVEIYDDRILMRGSLPSHPGARPLWLDPAIPFIIAGARPGEQMPTIKTSDGNRERNFQIIAREQVEVPAGTYPAIRVLMTGTDGQIETRRTTWFTPGLGIVKEEKLRYGKGKLLLRETIELRETSVRYTPRQEPKDLQVPAEAQ